MKELSIEEKAKRYDEALKVLHKYDGANIMFSQSLKEEMFPELKESWDERIRKAIINVFASHADYEIFFGASVEDILAWLEKQAVRENPSKPYTFKPIIRLLEMIEPTDRLKSYCKKLIDSLADEGYDTDASIVGEYLKQINGEKVPMATMDGDSPSDTQETDFFDDFRKCDSEEVPDSYHKFSVGNCLTDGSFSYLIVSIHDGKYYLDGGYAVDIQFADEIYHLWDVMKDAKDGDILYSKDCNLLFIYKDRNTCHAGCNLNYMADNVIVDTSICIPSDSVLASIKQCRVLFEQMRKIGYEWHPIIKQVRPICRTIEKKKDIDDDTVRLNRIITFLENCRLPEGDIMTKDIAWLKAFGDKLGI